MTAPCSRRTAHIQEEIRDYASSGTLREAAIRDSTPKLQHPVVARFINKIMIGGKKGVAERIMYDALEMIERNTRRPAIEVFEVAMRNATPVLEVKPRRVGGANYQVPVEIKGERRVALAIRWILRAARSAQRQEHGREAGRRADRREQQRRRDDQAPRRYA